MCTGAPPEEFQEGRGQGPLGQPAGPDQDGGAAGGQLQQRHPAAPRAKVGPPLQVYRHERIPHGRPEVRERRRQLPEVLHDIHAGLPGVAARRTSFSCYAAPAAAAAALRRPAAGTGRGLRNAAGLVCLAATDLCQE